MHLSTFLAWRRIAVSAVLLLLTIPTWAGDTPEERASLQGVQAVTVLVRDLSLQAEADGLAKRDLHTEVEARLRKAGIAVEPTLDPVAGACLCIAVTTVKREADSTYAVTVRVELIQWVRLFGKPRRTVFSPTWGFSETGIMHSQYLRDTTERVAALVDEFIAAYLEQNPPR